MRYELIGPAGIIGSFNEEATALHIAREWLSDERRRPARSGTVVLQSFDDDDGRVDEQILSLRTCPSA